MCACARAHNYSFRSALLTPLFCNTAVYPFPPLSLLQVSFTALLTRSPSLFPLPTCSFRQSNVCLHIHMWEKTESSLTVARISLSSSHSCFNRLADILRYLVSGTLPGVRATLLRLHPVLMRLEGLHGVFDTWGPVWTLHPLKQSERKGYRSRLSALAGSRSQDNRSEAHVCALPFSFFLISPPLSAVDGWLSLFSLFLAPTLPCHHRQSPRQPLQQISPGDVRSAPPMRRTANRLCSAHEGRRRTKRSEGGRPRTSGYNCSFHRGFVILTIPSVPYRHWLVTVLWSVCVWKRVNMDVVQTLQPTFR